MPSQPTSQFVEIVARWLYERDAVEFIRIGWDQDSDGLKDTYRDRAQEIAAHVREAGLRVLTEKEIDSIRSDGFRQGFVDV